MSGTKDTSITTEITAAGTPITVTAAAGAKATFTAPETGIYTFTTGELEQGVTFCVTTSGTYDPTDHDISKSVYSGDSLSLKLGLSAGQMVVWGISPDADTTLTLEAKLTVGGLEALKPGQSKKVTLARSDVAGFVFTAPEAENYSFWTESNDYSQKYGILWDANNVNVENCLQWETSTEDSIVSGTYGKDYYNFGLNCSLQKGQTVYLKSLYYSSYSSGTFTVHAAKGSSAWYN